MLVDEYQDTNLPQYVLVRQLAEGHNDVFVVGDPDQAIYGWRGAELANIMSFQRDFPAARRIDLQFAYRSSARLLEAATAMIRHNANRLDHRLGSANPPGLPPAVHNAADPTAEASFAVSRAAARIARDNGSVAILYRTNAQSRAFETAFKRAGIPYRITGDKSFYDRSEIGDALACLQAASNPDTDDEAMRRFVDLPPHPRTGQKAAAQIDRMRAPTFWSRAALAVRTGTLPDRHTANLRLRFELATVIAAAARRLPLDDLVDIVLHETGYHQAVAASGDPDAADRLDNLAELGFDAAVFRRDAGQTDTAGPDERLQVLAEFLEHCRSMRAPKRAGAADIRVTLSTLHGAKRLEFDTVVIGGFDAEHLPPPRHTRLRRRQSERRGRRTPAGVCRHDTRPVRVVPQRASRHWARRTAAPHRAIAVPDRNPREPENQDGQRGHVRRTAGTRKAGVRSLNTHRKRPATPPRHRPHTAGRLREPERGSAC